MVEITRLDQDFKLQIKNQIFLGKVMHKRLSPKEHFFIYNIFYLFMRVLDIPKLAKSFKLFSYNKFNLLSFYEKDHSSRQKDSNSYNWIVNIIEESELKSKIDLSNIKVLTMPAMLGYVFNPVSFWLLYDNNQNLIGTLYEVNNTFGYTHSYLCYKDDFTKIVANDILKSKKNFYVSPFFKVEGEYEFRIGLFQDRINIFIDYYIDGKEVLKTSLNGKLVEFNDGNLWHCFKSYPLLTLRAITLIHYHALRLIIKKIPFFELKELNKTNNLNITIAKQEQENKK